MLQGLQHSGQTITALLRSRTVVNTGTSTGGRNALCDRWDTDELDGTKESIDILASLHNNSKNRSNAYNERNTSIIDSILLLPLFLFFFYQI